MSLVLAWSLVLVQECLVCRVATSLIGKATLVDDRLILLENEEVTGDVGAQARQWSGVDSVLGRDIGMHLAGTKWHCIRLACVCTIGCLIYLRTSCLSNVFLSQEDKEHMVKVNNIYIFLFSSKKAFRPFSSWGNQYKCNKKIWKKKIWKPWLISFNHQNNNKN